MSDEPPRDESDSTLLATASDHILTASCELSQGNRKDDSVIDISCEVRAPHFFHGTTLEVQITRGLNLFTEARRGIGRLAFQTFTSSPPLLLLGVGLADQSFESVLRVVRHAAQNPGAGLGVTAKVTGLNRNWTRSEALMVQSLEVEVAGKFGRSRDQDETAAEERRTAELQQLGKQLAELQASAARIDRRLRRIPAYIVSFGLGLLILIGLIVARLWR